MTFRQAVARLQAGGVVAIPTDTAYGLAADSRNPEAIECVKRLKGRAAHKPIALVAASLSQVQHFFVLSAIEQQVARRYWPGPLTLLLKPKPGRLAARVLTPTRRIGVRVPARAVIRRLCQFVGAPLTATSANRSGQPSCYTARAVHAQLPTVDVLGSARLRKRPVSTIAIITHGHLRILRSGPVVPTIPS